MRKNLLNTIIFSLLIALISPLVVNAMPTEYEHGVSIDKKSKVYEGFTLFTPLGGGTGAEGSNEVYLIDMRGNVVHTWEVEYAPGLYGFLLENGNLLYGGNTRELQPTPGGGGGGVIQEIDWDGNVVWEYRDMYMHHDFDKLPNGNYLVLAWEKLSPENMDRVQGGLEGEEYVDPETGEESIWGDVIYEIDKDTKEIVWEWSAEDELVIEDYPLSPLNNRHEWTHGNTVEYLPEGNSYNGKPAVMTSFRQNDVVMIIDYETKDVLWEWGLGEIKYQHDPILLDNGNILIFDNGMHRPDTMRSGIPASRIVEVDPKSDEIVWEYTGGGLRGYRFFSSVISGAQRLPNGNTLICEGVTGRVFEVTKGEKIEYPDSTPDILMGALYDNEIVWEYNNPYYSPTTVENALFRAYRYGVDDINWPVEMPDPYPAEEQVTTGIEFDRDTIILGSLVILLLASVGFNVKFLLKKENE